MSISHIVAVSNNWVIGEGGAMPWHISDDLRYFKAKTTGKPLVMGRKTFDSLGKPLPGRLNIVVTRSSDFAAPGAVVCHSLDEAFAKAQEVAGEWGNEVMVIGGGEIYRATLPLVDRIYLTRVDLNCEGDTKYPEVDLEKFRVVAEDHGSGSPPVVWQVLERVRS